MSRGSMLRVHAVDWHTWQKLFKHNLFIIIIIIRMPTVGTFQFGHYRSWINAGFMP